MPKPITSFHLTVEDVDLIERALHARSSELSARRLALSEEDPAQLQSIRAADTELRETESLLGRLHDQKVFFRPRKGVYVSG